MKPSKPAVDSVRDCSEAQSSKSVCSKRCVSDRKRSVCSKGSAKKSCDQRPHRRKSSVHVDSETESDDKSCNVDKRRAYIKPHKFNGNTPTCATFKAQFMNAAKFNKWNDDEQLAFLKSSLPQALLNVCGIKMRDVLIRRINRGSCCQIGLQVKPILRSTALSYAVVVGSPVNDWTRYAKTSFGC